MIFIDWHGIWQRIKRKYWWIDSIIDKAKHETAVVLGYTGPLFARRVLSLTKKALFWHFHVIGNTGSGKSELLKQFIREFRTKEIPFCLIDPHSQLAESTLADFVRSGYFDEYYDPVTGELSKEVLQKFLYIDFGRKDEQNLISHFLPFNVLKQPYTPGDIGEDIVEVLYRIWPYLEQAAPQMTDIVKNAVKVMIANQLPILKIQSVLKNRAYREELLKKVGDPASDAYDPAVVEYFHYRFDEWDARYAPQMVESTLNKFSNLLSSARL